MPTGCLHHLCDPTAARAETRRLQGQQVPRGGFHKAGEGPAFGDSFVSFSSGRKTPCGANPGWQVSAGERAQVRPSEKAPPFSTSQFPSKK